MWKRILLAVVLASAACKKSQPPPANSTPPPSVLPAWKQRANELSALIKVGMTQDEVLKIAGKPNRWRQRKTLTWEYEFTDYRYFHVLFDESNRVVYARMASVIE